MKITKRGNVKLQILGHLPSGNQLLRMHWAKRNRVIKQWAWAVKQGLQKAKILYIGNVSYFGRPVSVNARVFILNKRMEKDRSNIITALDKLVIDHLVTQKVLVDDSPEYLEWGFINQPIGKPERIELELVEH